MQVNRNAFGIHFNKTTTPFHSLNYGSVRLWDSGVTWRELEPSDGTFSRTTLDHYAAMRNVELFYECGQPPNWATGDTKAGGSGSAYNALPPDNISDWTAYLTWVDDNYAFAAYGVWNEPTNTNHWQGTKAQLRDLHEAAYDLLHPRGRVIVSACPSDGGGAIGSGTAYLFDYLTTAIIAKTDAIGFHSYVNPLAPEAMITSLRHLKAVLRRLGAGHLPIWNTEYTWPTYYLNGSLNSTDDMTQALGSAYIARSMLANIIGGASRFFFYGMDFAYSKLQLLNIASPATLYDPATAYLYWSQFLADATISRFRQVPPLYSADWSKAGASGRIYWCRDDQTQNVDLSGFRSGVGVLGNPITLSASYSVTHSPVIVTR